MTRSWSKNKKGAALVYAIMVLLLLSTVIVALTALSNASYTDAVLAASDDQSYYYAKSIGLAVKEQFKDGYNIARIIASLNEQENNDDIDDPKVTGTFTIADAEGDLVTGSLQIRYARDSSNNVNDQVIEVRSACVVNNSVAVVTSVFSCEDDSGEESSHLMDALNDYDVILTDIANPDFDFSQATGSSNGSNLSVYVYAGEDDNVSVPPFDLHVDLAGRLTTTGKTIINSKARGSEAWQYHKITGNLTCYGDVGLNYTGVDGANGIHCDGNVVLGTQAYVKNDIYARGAVSIADPAGGPSVVSYDNNAGNLNYNFVGSGGLGVGGSVYKMAEGEFHSAHTVYAQGDVNVGARAWLTGSIYTHGSVSVTGKGAYGGRAWANLTSYHYGNTLIEGSIYAEGNVVITSGAIVGGDIFANGSVLIQDGAVVVGNVQSLNGSVTVYNGVIGGQVNCPKGVLTLDNSKFPSASYYLAECDDPSAGLGFIGTMVLGGIGCFQYNTVHKHTCNQLLTTDTDMVSVSWGNLYVANPTADYGYTPLFSVWIQGALYLENSTASFGLIAPNGQGGTYDARAYAGSNTAGNAYTYVVELNQKMDLCSYASSGYYVNMYGAHVLTINVGSSKTSLYDAYLWNGCVTNVNARCLHLADMTVDPYGLLYASQHMQVWGTGIDYAHNAYYTRSTNPVYTHAQSGTNGVTVIPGTVRIDVACMMPSYDGIFADDISCGFYQTSNSVIYGTVNVGSDSADLINSMVWHEDGQFLGEMNAYVANYHIYPSVRLSTVKDSASYYTAADIYAEVNNGFFVYESNSNGEYRWGSDIQVKGNAQVNGWVYNFDHFDGTIANSDTAKFKGTFRTTGAEVKLSGKNCFSGEVHATNPDCTFSLKGDLTVGGLRVNGKFNSNDYTLTVNGNAYINKMNTQINGNIVVTGNLTIASAATNLQPQNKFEVTGDLFIGGSNSLTLNKSAHKVTGKVQVEKGNITVSNSASIGGAKTTKTLTVSGGSLTGSFDVGTFTMTGGTVAPASNRVRGKIAGVFTHSGGLIKNSDIEVLYSGTDKPAVAISGTATGESVFINANSGYATVTGGSNVDYSIGALRTKYTTSIQGGFRCGISVSNGDLYIGSTSQTTDLYNVGTCIQSGDPENDSYRVIYASGNIDWGYGARATYDAPQMYVDITRVTAGGNVTMGRSDYYVKGMFSGVYAANGYVNIYAEKVDGVYAKGNSWVHVSGALGNTKNSKGSGVKITNGDVYVYGKTGNEYLRGHNEVSGVFYLETQMNAEGCLIKCRDISGLSNFKKVENCAPISLHLTKPAKGPDGYYELTTGIEGAFTIMNSNLKYSSPVKIKGEIYVDGILKYGGSTEDVECLGGMYCKNDKINVTSAFKGNVHLPNVTTLTLNADIGVNAPKVTNFELNIDITHSLNLASCDRLTVASGRSVSGSVIIKNTGKITNNGTIGDSADCGTYEGSGTVGKDLVTHKSGATITGSGKVTGNIWVSGDLNITSSETFGKSGSYIYASGSINITNAWFASGMNYILSTGGDIYMKNCRDIPKVWNNSGSIVFENDSSHTTNIASVLSYGKHIYFGTAKTNNYQTVTGDVEWYGTDKSVDYGVEFWGNNHTTVNGKMLLFGTGNVHTSNATFNGPVHFRNSGTIDASSGGAFNGASVTIGYSNKSYDSIATINASIKGNLMIWGTAKAEITLGSTVGSASDNYIHVHKAKSLTINGAVTGSINVGSVTNTYLNKSVSGGVTVGYGTLTTKEEKNGVAGTIGGNLRAYNSDLHINANVGGNITHSAPNISDSNPMNLVALGNQKKMITVNGNITVHGRLVDNSQQLGSGRTIKCKGAYYADLQKEFNDGNSENGKGCTHFYFEGEAGGRCYILGSKGGNYTVYNTVFDINGHLSIYTFYNEADTIYYQMTFNKAVTCNSLIVNSNCPSTTSTTATVSGAPTQKIGFYGKSENSGKAKGIDKRCWFENFETYDDLDIYYTNDTYSGKCTHYDRMYFKGNVNVGGVCIASHTKFGAQLKTAGQTSLAYCLLYSSGYSNDTNHCSVKIQEDGSTASSDNLANLKNDGVFLHTTSTGGENYFNHVKTYSNVAVYNGASHIFGGSVFKGCVYDGSGQSNMYNGHRSTKFFYFGNSVELYGESAITSNGQPDVDLCCGRTIVWVNSGNLTVKDGSYIGAERVFASNTGSTTNTNRHSVHPGIFVTNGSVSVIGKNSSTPSTITLDICAYSSISISNYGQVFGKNKKNDTFRYIAGLYTTKGSITESSNGFFGYNHLDGDTRGKSGCIKTRVFTGSDYSASNYYTPNGSGYCTNFNKKQGTYEKYTIGSGGDLTTQFSQTTAQLTSYYTPRSSAPTVATPASGFTASNMTNASGISVTDTVILTETAKPSAPTAPVVQASGGLNTNGDASVSPLKVENNNSPDSQCTATIEAPDATPAKVGAAASNISFNGGRASNNPLYWTSPNYKPSGTSVTHPSSAWTSSITKHFDKTQTKYWNTRFIPYVWKLPYEGTTTGGSSGSTPAKRILQAQSDDIEINGEMILNQTSSSGYYTNEAQYAGSSLADFASKIYGYRSKGVSSGGRLYDVLKINSYPEWNSPVTKKPDHKRRTKILVFESGELPYNVFFMGGGTSSDDYASWNNSSAKKIREANQKAWRLGDPDVSFYDGSLVFYTCADPSNPYNSAAKDLHVVLPQGIGFDFVVDAENTVTVVGKGRLFLYLTSGDTVCFRAKATDSVYANPVGGLKANSDGTYSPLMYIIGAGTNIDLYIDRMPVSAFIYMPFGSDARLYDASNGSLKQYNNFKNAEGNQVSSLYSGTGKTTNVANNTLHLLWDGTSGGARNICGTIVADNFIYQATSNCLNFKNYSDAARTNRKVVPDFSNTTIYSYSTTGNSTRSGKTYPIDTFLINAPGYSTSLLNWEYKGIRVEG